MKIRTFLSCEWGPPNPDLWIVIPCHNEPELKITLESLAQAEMPETAVGVVVVINAAENAADEVLQQNQASWQEACSLAEKGLPYRLYVLDVQNMPRKHAGVGLARRIGMDWVSGLKCQDLPYWSAAESRRIIVNLDADCRVASNYFTALWQHFLQYPETPGAALYYEHPLSGPLDPRLYQGIAYYELFLRFYVHALRWAGFPWAFQTVGSAMAVRSDVYLKIGGMNKRKAGEDFYFLNKVIEQGRFSEIRNTLVIPSPRVSDRVPFGTGKAMKDWLAGAQSHYPSYALQSFVDLKELLKKLPELYHCQDPETLLQDCSRPLQLYLQSENFADKLREIQGNVATEKAFKKRFFQWFNAFRTMKALHFLREHYGQGDLLEAAQAIARKNAWSSPTEVQALLHVYRAHDCEPEVLGQSCVLS